MVKKMLPRAQEIVDDFRAEADRGSWMEIQTVDFDKYINKLLNIIEAQDGMAEHLNHELEIARSALQNCANKEELYRK